MIGQKRFWKKKGSDKNPASFDDSGRFPNSSTSEIPEKCHSSLHITFSLTFTRHLLQKKIQNSSISSEIFLSPFRSPKTCAGSQIFCFGIQFILPFEQKEARGRGVYTYLSERFPNRGDLFLLVHQDFC